MSSTNKNFAGNEPFLSVCYHQLVFFRYKEKECAKNPTEQTTKT
jgi:hypothetical protein